MFGIKSKIQTAADMDRLIHECEARAAGLQSQFNEADAAAMAAAAGDEGEYSAAATLASELRGKLADANERLARLRGTRADSRATEKADYVHRLRERLAHARKKQMDDMRASRERDCDAERRFNASLQEERIERDRIAGSCAAIERELAMAESGLCEGDCNRIVALQEEVRTIRAEMGGLNAIRTTLDRQVSAKRLRIFSVGFGRDDAARHAAGVELASLEDQLSKAEPDVRELKRRIAECEEEIRSIMARTR